MQQMVGSFMVGFVVFVVVPGHGITTWNNNNVQYVDNNVFF